jgi:hypothetical protein
LTFFDTPKVALVLSAVDLKEKGLLDDKTYYDIACDIRTIVYQNYIHYNDKEVKSIQDYGKFFPEVLRNPEKYIQPQPELFSILSELKSKGKKLFLATNSHAEYCEFILKATLGERWNEIFDIVCSYCRKPIFFWDQKVLPPFYKLDKSKANFKGKPILNPDDIQNGKIYLEGNSKLLKQYF